MSSPKSYNTVAPTVLRTALTRTLEVGWEHTVDGNDIVYTTDAAGNPVPRTYNVPAKVSAKQLLAATNGIGPERLKEIQQTSNFDAVVEVLGALIGEDILLTIAADPTVSPEVFVAVITDLAEGLDLGGVMPGGVPSELTAPTTAQA